jgi:[acyl-carrier-protein] S-malonyltransferase
MSKLAICFSGQGSQYLNMGIDFIDGDEQFRKMALEASKILDFDVIDAYKDEDKMKQTLYVQPLVVLKSIFGYEKIKSLNPNVSAVLGFSLGEYSAYYASEVFDLDQILTIISKRALYMEEQTQKQKGLMAAIIGLGYDEVNRVCESLSDQGVIKLANENSPNQFVISGEEALVVKAIEELKSIGARRAVVLNTSGAFHTPLMEEASKKLVQDIKNNVILKPKQHKLNMYMNLDAKLLKDEDIYKHVEKQMTHSVKFIDSIVQMKKDGITHMLEIGPGKVLTGLIKKIDADIDVMSFDSYDSFDAVKGWLNTHEFTK